MSYLNFLEVRLSVALCDEEARHVVLADVELAMSPAEAKLVEEQLRARRRAEDRTPPVSWMRVRLRECVCGRGQPGSLCGCSAQSRAAHVPDRKSVV